MSAPETQLIRIRFAQFRYIVRHDSLRDLPAGGLHGLFHDLDGLIIGFQIIIYVQGIRHFTPPVQSRMLLDYLAYL